MYVFYADVFFTLTQSAKKHGQKLEHWQNHNNSNGKLIRDENFEKKTKKQKNKTKNNNKKTNKQTKKKKKKVKTTTACSVWFHDGGWAFKENKCSYSDGLHEPKK